MGASAGANRSCDRTVISDCLAMNGVSESVFTAVLAFAMRVGVPSKY